MQRRKSIILALSGLCASLAAGCGGASVPSLGNPFASGPNTFDVTFISAAETWDLDKDTVVTCAEWQQYATTSFAESDADGDGALTDAEFKNMARTDRLFDLANLKYYDRNSDGKVSREELTGKKNRAFELLDKNKDCKLERNEKVQVRYKQKKKDDSDASGESIKGPQGR